MTIGKTITIADIQTRDILFYDPDLKEKCYRFCETRNIDYLPSLDDEFKIYQRDKVTKSFIEQIVARKKTISGVTNAFNKEMLNTFRNQPLCLVFENDALTGVVHFADYGKPVVSFYLYELFFDYEKQLRELLFQQGLNDSDMIAYFENKKKSDDDFYDRKLQGYQKKIAQEKRSPFELFQLRDLIALANHKKMIKLKDVGDLRNMIMHAHELVSMEDPFADDYIYKFDSFIRFFELAIELHIDRKRVANRNAFNENYPRL